MAAMASREADLLERAILLIRHEWGYTDEQVREWIGRDDEGWDDLRSTCDEMDRFSVRMKAKLR